MCLDLLKVTVAGNNGVKERNRKHWKLVMDEYTGKKWSEFSETKSGMVKPTCKWLNKMKDRGIPIKCIHMDPGGENIK